MMTSRLRLVAAIALGAAALLAVAGLRSLGDRTADPPVAPAAAPGAPSASTGLPHKGDCGVHEHGSVRQTVCGDRRADVEVARIHLGGDPGQICPLFRPNAVLFTTVTQDLFVCWVPRGGGPPRSFDGPATGIAVPTVPLVQEGMCGLVHAEHVHHPLDCADPVVNAVAAAVFATGEAGGCPPDTAREEHLADGARVCWSAA